MKDLKKLANECIAELTSIGIQPGKINFWLVNTRAKTRWGQCRRVAPGEFTISISERLLHDYVEDMATKNTIMHELLHTVKGCHGHTGLWKELAITVNYKLPGYNIKRTTGSEEKGVPSGRTNRYGVKCPHCGKEYYRERMCRLIEHPERFRCGVCTFPLERLR